MPPASYTVSPAYGRDYPSAKAAAAAFLSGADFTDQSYGATATYVSVRDLPAGSKVSVRYKRMTMVTVVTVPPAGA